MGRLPPHPDHDSFEFYRNNRQFHAIRDRLSMFEAHSLPNLPLKQFVLVF
jgi:hypothetical protein